MHTHSAKEGGTATTHTADAYRFRVVCVALRIVVWLCRCALLGCPTGFHILTSMVSAGHSGRGVSRLCDKRCGQTKRA